MRWVHWICSSLGPVVWRYDFPFECRIAVAPSHDEGTVLTPIHLLDCELSKAVGVVELAGDVVVPGFFFPSGEELDSDSVVGMRKLPSRCCRFSGAGDVCEARSVDLPRSVELDTGVCWPDVDFAWCCLVVAKNPLVIGL